MADERDNPKQAARTEQAAPQAATQVAPGPHLFGGGFSTRRMMLDVCIGLLPATVAAIIVFQLYAVAQIVICVASCVIAEALFTKMRGRALTIGDFSAVVTGLILAFSLPATCPWWVSVIGSFAAIGLGKAVFGGVGQNIFNPAMVGRAFVMIAFTSFIGASGYVAATEGANANVTQTIPWQFSQSLPDAITQATPMETFKQTGQVTPLVKLLLGNTNGSLGETSALALLLGGAYLLIRRVASWEIPAGAAIGLLVVAGIDNLLHTSSDWTVLHHLLGGAFLLGAMFIVTDPVTSPLTPKGKFTFGAVFGVLVMLMRLGTNYPEGVMFSVLLVNAITPLLNRWTIPRPVGGPTPAPAKK
ncbi:MAG TPA: RnfABCDGE type electron transport complex subunit D [Phycisphaerae bacterium]|nr:RnfABCDGE type electron transport complex subunit D [Phycisphaerae bacterium]HUT58841.1 RnfABCDGE type electron transport complex subunit D [Phycisphaerae bacterium]